MESDDATAATPHEHPDPWARIFAAFYGPSILLGELAGMRAMRRGLLAQARGRTVEIGGGSGQNLRHYPQDLGELTVTEPEPAMRERLRRKAVASAPRAQVIDAPAERLPFADASVDTVVSTLVLCTVDDPALALREVARVLAPGGQLLLIEHVRAHSERLARWQDRLAAPWQRFAVGCRCNRPTGELIADAGMKLEARDEVWRAMPAIIRPLIVGRAAPERG